MRPASRCRPRPRRSRTSRSRPSAGVAARLECDRLVTSGYLVSNRLRLPGFTARRRLDERGLGGRPLGGRDRVRSAGDGDVLGGLPRLQGLARGRAGGARAAARRRARRSRTGGADIAVLNTCCVTHEAISKSRKAASRLARTHGRVYVTGCGANLADGCLRRPARQRRRRREAERGDAAGGRRRRRRDRLRPGRRPARPRPRVREGAGRLQLLVLVLRDPARARCVAEPAGRRGARRGAPPRRAGSQGGRADRDQPRLLPRPRGRLPSSRGSSARSAPRRASRACGSRRSRSTISTRSSSPRCARRRPSRRTCTCRSSPATTASCGRWAGATGPTTFLRRLALVGRTST